MLERAEAVPAARSVRDETGLRPGDGKLVANEVHIGGRRLNHRWNVSHHPTVRILGKEPNLSLRRALCLRGRRAPRLGDLEGAGRGCTRRGW